MSRRWLLVVAVVVCAAGCGNQDTEQVSKVEGRGSQSEAQKSSTQQPNDSASNDAPTAQSSAKSESTGPTSEDQVEVIATSAPIKVGDAVVATVKQGQRLSVLNRKGPWIAVSVETPAGELEGWIFVTKVKPVIHVGVTENSTAPGPLQLVKMDVAGTQVVSGFPGRLFVQLTIANEGANPVPYSASDINLVVDDQTVSADKASDRESIYESVYADGTMNDEVMASELPYLTAGDIAPGGKAVGWMSFQLPKSEDFTPQEPIKIAQQSCVIRGEFGDNDLEMDLKEVEVSVLGAQIRPSEIDDRVKVLEFGNRVNALNVEKLIELYESLEEGGEPFIMRLASEGWVMDEVARRAFSSLRSRGTSVPFIGLPGNTRISFPMGYGGSEANDETVAVIRALGAKPSTGTHLVKYLTDSSPNTRTAAAIALGRHLDESGIVDALLKATTDEAPEVRVASIQSVAAIGSFPTYRLPSMPGTPGMSRGASTTELTPSVLQAVIKATKDKDAKVRVVAVTAFQKSKAKEATAALLERFRDSEATVRATAARTAASHPPEQVTDPLLALLEDRELNVVASAASTLGRLQAKKAVPRLRELEKGQNKQLAGVAVEALKQIGDISPVDAAIRKLGVTQLNSNELRALAESKDKRAVSKLLEAIQAPAGQSRSYPGSGYSGYTNQIIEVLGDIGDPAAVEPLIDRLTNGRGIEEKLPLALGKLGDKRAIKPLQETLGKTRPGSRERLSVHEALLMLDAPGAFDQFKSELDEAGNGYRVREYLHVLGRAGVDQTVPLLEKYLDNQQLCQPASQALLRNGGDEALTAIRTRLLDKTSQTAMMIMMGIRSATHYVPARTTNEDIEVMWRALKLFDQLKDSENPMVRSNINQYLVGLSGSLAEIELREFNSLVAKKAFDDADKAYRQLIDRHLGLHDDREVLPRMVMALRSRMGLAYRRASESERVDKHLAKTIETVGELLAKSDSEQLKSLYLSLRVSRFIANVQRETGLDQAEYTGLVTELSDVLRKKVERGAVASDLSKLKGVGIALERAGHFEQAISTYRNAIDIVGDQREGVVSEPVQQIEGAINRLQMIGESIELTGTTTDGDSFDLSSYRGKVVLMTFWLSYYGDCAEEVRNIKRLYESHHDRGFEVVGICPCSESMLQALERFLSKEKLPWVNLHDADNSLQNRFGILRLPTSILLDKEGRVVSTCVHGSDLEEAVEQHLRTADK